MKTFKKLIEVALPLEAINVASAREKSIRHGHPSTLHLWWARRPLAAARAVIFAQMVDDPSEYVDTLLGVPETKRAAQRELKKRHELWVFRKAAFEAATGKEAVAVPEPGPEPTLEDCAADIERQRLFRIIEELVKWENTTNEHVLEKARAEIWQSWRRTCAANADHPKAKELFDRHKLPAFHDPFAGGGALPLEAQRLGLEAYASDLNPVAVLINKAMIEIPPKFAGRLPVNPESRKEAEHGELRAWKGAQGLAEDVRYYGKWMRDEAEKRIGHLYPKVEVTTEIAAERPDLKPYVGKKLTVIAWLWARTVKSPNPAFRTVDVPLASTFMLSTKAGKEAYVEPVIENGGYRFTVMVGKPNDAESAKAGTKLGRGANFKCLMSGTPIEGDYIKAEGKAGQLGARLMAIVAEGDRGRVYLPPTEDQEAVANEAHPTWRPDVEFFQQALGFRVGNYGMSKWSEVFSERQIAVLATFAALAREVNERIRSDAIASSHLNDKISLCDGGTGPSAYADAVAIYMAFALGRCADKWATLAIWNTVGEKIEHVFGMQTLRMTWDFAEGNPFSNSTGNWISAVAWGSRFLDMQYATIPGAAVQLDAQSQLLTADKVVSTDPPYYDNVGYADLSDFFYVWLREPMRPIFPKLFVTLTTPKSEELVATPGRHGGRDRADDFFLRGMTQAMRRLSEQGHPAFPVTIYYAFKQSESDAIAGSASTGWETFLDAVICAGFSVSGTWPMRTERAARLRNTGSNALASSIILVCRPRSPSAATVTRREFLNALKAELPEALRQLQRGNIAPVDLAQASIGPGMAVFTRYAKVVDADGKAMSVREALAIINEVLDGVLAEQEGDFDADTRWALAWFEQFGFADGEFGVAETLSKAKVTSVAGLVEAGIAHSKAGKVRLLKPAELSPDWNPETDARLTIWEIVHHLIRVSDGGGEGAAAALVARLGVKAEVARDLAYRLYTLCERKKRAAEALAYNALVQSWPEISRLSQGMAATVNAGPAEPMLDL